MSLGAIDPGRSDRMRQQAPRSGRAAVAIPVDLHVEDGPTSAVTRNISPDGLFVVTHRLLPVGERILLMLAFPGDRRPLAVRAEVRWFRATPPNRDENRPAGMGLRFVDPPLGVTLSIADVIESQRTDERP